MRKSERQHAIKNPVYAGTSYKEAVQLVTATWKKSYGRVPPPACSHALSNYDSDTGSWEIRCAETGEILARVIDGYAALVVDQETGEKASVTPVAASVGERGAITQP